MDSEQKKRLGWISLYEEIGNAGIVCLRCGISRPTLRKWRGVMKLAALKHYLIKADVLITLPHVKSVLIKKPCLILATRRERKLGVRRLQHELKRLHELSLSLATIHKVLAKHGQQYLKTKRHYRKQHKRYSCKIPGERVQMDVCKIAAGLYQYTAIDDCRRWKVLALYKRRTAKNTLDFLDQVCERMPFPIQRFQTD